MRFLKNPFSLLLAAVFLVFLFTRLFHLTILPIFTDESIYIYWAKIVQTSNSQWFISLTDGKPPMLVWGTTFFLHILPDTMYLVAGRLNSVVAGLISLFAIYKITELLFKNKYTALTAAALYTIFPFTLLYDRLALFDSLLQSMLLLSTYFALKTVQTRKVLFALLWGVSLGFAFLSKPTAVLFVLLLPIAAVAYSFNDLQKHWKSIGGLIVLATVIGEGINNLQRLSSVYFMAGLKNAQFQQPIEELIQNPFALTFSNMQGFFNWIVGYYTVPFLLFGLIGLAILLWKNFRVGVILLLLWISPIIALATVGREIFPRYILFTTPYFLLPAAYAFGIIAKKTGKYMVVSILLAITLLIPFLRTDWAILTNPTRAAIPKTDYDQLIALHPSGYGIDTVMGIINTDLENGKNVTLVTQGTFGIYPYAFMLEYWGNKEITILPRWPLSEIDQEIFDAQRNSQVYVLLKEHDTIPPHLSLTLVKKIEKPGGQDPLLLTIPRQ